MMIMMLSNSEKEWIVTNGLGGYASLTLSGTNTRKYHGLLVASLRPPLKRWVIVSNMLEEIDIGGEKFRLAEYLTDFQNLVWKHNIARPYA